MTERGRQSVREKKRESTCRGLSAHFVDTNDMSPAAAFAAHISAVHDGWVRRKNARSIAVRESLDSFTAAASAI
jgi:hypothetical protein